MAIISEKEWKGLILTYWNISQIKYDKINDETTVWITAYKDKATRLLSILNNVKEMTKMYVFSGNLTIEQCYIEIKLDNYFVLAIDDI